MCNIGPHIDLAGEPIPARMDRLRPIPPDGTGNFVTTRQGPDRSRGPSMLLAC